VYLSVCLSICLRKLNNFLWNVLILLTPYKHFCVGVSDQLVFRVQPCSAIQLASRKSIFSLGYCPAWMWHTILDTTGLGIERIGSLIFIFGVGPEILGSDWVVTQDFFGFLHRIEFKEYFIACHFLIRGCPGALIVLYMKGKNFFIKMHLYLIICLYS
jgi:hypothetical protein